MAAAVSLYERGLLSGLFITEPETGWILYRASRTDDTSHIGFNEFERIYDFEDPRGMVFAEPSLYVYDAGPKTISALLLQGEEAVGESRPIGQLVNDPSHIAVSPHGLVAVMDRKQVVFLQEGHDPITYASRFSNPIDMTFSAWHTLNVLDADRNALVSISFTRLSNGDIAFDEEREVPVPNADSGQHWRAMGIYEGVLYLADDRMIYAYLESDRRLVPVVPRSASHGGVSQLALTYQSMYLLEQDHIRRFPRAQPVDLTLEGGPDESQLALMALYLYLDSVDLLPTRDVLVRSTYATLGQFLAEEGVLLLDPSRRRDKARISFWQQSKAQKTEGTPERSAFESLLCALNSTYCEKVGSPAAAERLRLTSRLARGTTLKVPWVQLSSRLGRRTVELDGQTALEHMKGDVLSADLLKGIDSTLLLKLNRGWSEKDLARRKKGRAVVPVEYWTAMPAVRASDFGDPSSSLWSLPRRYTGVDLFGREVFTKQAAAFLPNPAAAIPPTTCDVLKMEHSKWLKAIGYPLHYETQAGSAPGEEPSVSTTLVFPDIHQGAVRVGILEHATTVKQEHQIFWTDAGGPAWHQADNLTLVASPGAASYANVNPAAEGTIPFSKGEHHGTHVAAIIGGRQSECWSGLLPRARLVLVDLTDVGTVRRDIVDSVAVGTRVFNVSQEFPGPQDSLRRTIVRFRDQALFVAAAGNATRDDQGTVRGDLNPLDAASVPAPARWGAQRNVVTVSGIDWDTDLLTDLNHGKRYVDLVAPGEDVLGATAPPGQYSLASGSSQAAPQVAAAAAMLLDDEGIGQLSPGDAKARLIATARWDDKYGNNVWGGRLDFGTAVLFPQRTFLRTTTGAALGRLYSIKRDGNPLVQILGAPEYHERQGQGAIAPARIHFDRILSLRKKTGTQNIFRVVFKEPVTDKLKILLSAALKSDERIRCHSLEVFNPKQATFTPSNACQDGIAIDQVEDYFRGGNYRVRWGE